MGALEIAIELDSAGHKIFWVGGMASYRLGDLADLAYLKAGRKDLIKNKKMAAEFNTFLEFKEKARLESNRLINALDRIQSPVSLFNRLANSEVKSEIDSSAIITTAHRSKGRGWNNVFIHNDFQDLLDLKTLSGKRLDDEIHLSYGAITRAKRVLAMREGRLTEALDVIVPKKMRHK